MNCDIYTDYNNNHVGNYTPFDQDQQLDFFDESKLIDLFKEDETKGRCFCLVHFLFHIESHCISFAAFRFFLFYQASLMLQEEFIFSDI